MNKLRLARTTADNADFHVLVRLLDDYLKVVDGDDHAFYTAFNALAGIHHVVVAYHAGDAVGCGAMKFFAPGVMEVKRMFVDPAHRGQGIAQAILAELEEWAHEGGYAGFVLETGIRQAAAIRLYEREGFTRTPNYGQYVGVEASVCFQKTISNRRVRGTDAE